MLLIFVLLLCGTYKYISINITINIREERKFSIKYSDMASDILLAQDYHYSLSNTPFRILIHPLNTQVSTATLTAAAAGSATSAPAAVLRFSCSCCCCGCCRRCCCCCYVTIASAPNKEYSEMINRITPPPWN